MSKQRCEPCEKPVLEKRQADPNLQKFFHNLLKLKEYINTCATDSDDDPLLWEIHDRLDQLIKEDPNL